MQDMHVCDVARKATWQSHASPRGRLHGAEVGQTHGNARRVHADAPVAPRGSVRGLRVMGLITCNFMH